MKLFKILLGNDLENAFISSFRGIFLTEKVKESGVYTL